MLKEIINNQFLVLPFFAWLIAQVIKFFIFIIMEKKIDFKRLIGDGGMPSGHSALVSSLAAICGLEKGFYTVEFAIAFIFAIVVFKDAAGVRRETGKQAQSIKELALTINQIFLEKNDEIRTEKLKEFVGHTPLQVFFGCLIGVLTAVTYFFWIK